jgi:hypothetical protein
MEQREADSRKEYTYVYEKTHSVCAQEYEDSAVLVRCSAQGVVSCGFDLSPAKAIEFGKALIAHGQALQARQEAKEVA